MTGLDEPYWFYLNMFLALFAAEALAQFVSHLVPHFIIGMALIAGVSGRYITLYCYKKKHIIITREKLISFATFIYFFIAVVWSLYAFAGLHGCPIRISWVA
mmetsp:Transcript_23810/g.31626  ORF Transcript_23810/g.31626 Transcript_23810/m.31626 type:complete len:102 (-) Transcript_23810:493-798(-)